MASAAQLEHDATARDPAQLRACVVDGRRERPENAADPERAAVGEVPCTGFEANVPVAWGLRIHGVMAREARRFRTTHIPSPLVGAIDAVRTIRVGNAIVDVSR
jgi:hypothetical protein